MYLVVASSGYHWDGYCCFVVITVPFNDISVDSVWPLYGPVAGGTNVTITGQFLSVHIVTDVYFGEHRRHPDTNR